MHTILHADPIPPSELNNTLTKEIDAVVNKALQKRPDDRFRSAREFLETLRTNCNMLQQGKSPKTLQDKSVWIILASFLLCAAIIVFIASWWLSANQQKIHPATNIEPVPSNSQNAYGSIEIKSKPPGAVVLLDNETPVGLTPITVNLPPGKYQLLLKKEGFHELEASIDVETASEIPLDVRLIEIERSPGKIKANN